LPELVVVIALLALAAMVTIPLAARKVNELRLRSAVDHFVVSLRAARMAAASSGRSVTVTVTAHPTNTYSYSGVDGREHSVALPSGLRIDAASTPGIVFRANGSLDAESPATTVLKAKLPHDVIERWTVETPLTGVPTVSRELVEHAGDDW
jgi:Tfp pilus assembly protein FimT